MRSMVEGATRTRGSEPIAPATTAGAIPRVSRGATSPLHRPSAGPPPPLRGGGKAPAPPGHDRGMAHQCFAALYGSFTSGIVANSTL